MGRGLHQQLPLARESRVVEVQLVVDVEGSVALDRRRQRGDALEHGRRVGAESDLEHVAAARRVFHLQLEAASELLGEQRHRAPSRRYAA